MTVMRITVPLAVLAFVAGGSSRAPALLLPPGVLAQERPLPDTQEFFEVVRANMARADREQYRYAYRERRTEVHTNPFGRLGTGGTLLYEVQPGDEYGVYHRQLVARDGDPVSGEKRETVDRRGRSGTSSSVDDVVATLEFSPPRRETAEGRDMIAVDFTPKRDARPQTRQGKLAKVFAGTIWVDEAAMEVARVEAASIDSISYGLGFVARLSEGTQVELRRERVDESIWLPTSIRVKGRGRAMLFIRRLNVDYVIEWFDYRRMLESD